MQKAGLTYPQALSRLRKAHDFVRDAIGEDVEPRLRAAAAGRLTVPTRLLRLDDSRLLVRPGVRRRRSGLRCTPRRPAVPRCAAGAGDEVRALWVVRTSPRLRRRPSTTWWRRRRPADSTRCSCRCAAAATRTTSAGSSRVRPRCSRSRRSIRWRGRSPRAHSAGPAVHAWINVNLVAGTRPAAARDHIVYRHPEWLMVPRALGERSGALDPTGPAVSRAA